MRSQSSGDVGLVRLAHVGVQSFNRRCEANPLATNTERASAERESHVSIADAKPILWRHHPTDASELRQSEFQSQMRSQSSGDMLLAMAQCSSMRDVSIADAKPILWRRMASLSRCGLWLVSIADAKPILWRPQPDPYTDFYTSEFQSQMRSQSSGDKKP